MQGGSATPNRQSFANLAATPSAAGLTLDHVMKVKVFLTNVNDFAPMNEAYRERFAEPSPARTTVGMAALPLGARVEIEMIAKR